MSRGNLIKSLLYVVFDASHLVCSCVRLVRWRHLDDDFTLPGWICGRKIHDTLLTGCEARHTWTNRLPTLGDVVHRTETAVGRSRGQLVPGTPVVRRILKQAIHIVYEDFISFPSFSWHVPATYEPGYDFPQPVWLQWRGIRS